MRRILVLALLYSPLVAAHDTWLRVAEQTPEHLRLELTSGMAFPQPETAIAKARIDRSGHWREGNPSGPEPSLSAAADHLSLRYQTASEAPGYVYVVLHPRSLELDADGVSHYFEELGAGEDLRDAYAADQTWRERYRKNAKLLVGDPPFTSEQALQHVLGLPFELVPVQDPRALVAGAVFAVRALLHGKPLSGQRVALVAAPSGQRLYAVTDEAGVARFVWPGGAEGMVSAIHLTRATDPTLDWESEFSTLSFKLVPR